MGTFSNSITQTGTVPHQSGTPGAGRHGVVSSKTLRGVHRPEKQIPKPHRNTEGGGNICPWHATRNTRDFKPLLVFPALRCMSRSGTRPLRRRHLDSRQARPLPAIRMKLFSGGNGLGRAQSVKSSILQPDQVQYLFLSTSSSDTPLATRHMPTNSRLLKMCQTSGHTTAARSQTLNGVQFLWYNT